MAPTSTPRVGSSKNHDTRLLDQTLPITTFCWFAAGKLDDASVVVDRFTFSFPVHSFRQFPASP